MQREQEEVPEKETGQSWRCVSSRSKSTYDKKKTVFVSLTYNNFMGLLSAISKNAK